MLGSSTSSNWAGSPIAGLGFATRYTEDFAALAQAGVSSVRLGIDWSRLQPSPGRLDDDWREWYQSVLLAAQRSGIEVWAALHEHTVPAWFDDEGSFADSRAAGLQWPRWVEAAAEHFGHLVAGWYPIVDPLDAAAPWSADPSRYESALLNVATAWRDAWRILRGGPPVATSLALRMVRPSDHTVPAKEAARLEDHLRWRLWLRSLRDGVLRLPNGNERTVSDLAASLDVLGASTSLDVPEGGISDESIRRWEERLGSLVRRLAEEGPERPLVLSGMEIRWQNHDERVLWVEATVRAVRAAIDDGVPLGTVLVDPAINRSADSAVNGSTERGAVAPAAILDRERNITREADAWRALKQRSDRFDDVTG